MFGGIAFQFEFIYIYIYCNYIVYIPPISLFICLYIYGFCIPECFILPRTMHAAGTVGWYGERGTAAA